MTRSNLTVDRWKTLNTIWRDLNAINWKRTERETYMVIFSYAYPNENNEWEARVSLEELQRGTGRARAEYVTNSVEKLENEIGLIKTIEKAKSRNDKNVFLVKHCLKTDGF